MTELHYQDDQLKLWHGDALETLRRLPDESAACVVTSPPYYGLRDYGEPGQYGLEPTPSAYVETMRAVFAEVRRVLAADGTLWLNLGDSYVGVAETGLPPKNLLGIPWRVAFALQDDGWILRNRITWSKTNAKPDPAKDRLSSTSEELFLFVRSPHYWFDLDPIREAYEPDSLERRRKYGRLVPGGYAPGDRKDANRGGPMGFAGHSAEHPQGKNPGDVWPIATQPFPGAHFAVMPPVLAERCILAGCKPGGTVLDPFCGSSTTGMVALKHGRRFVGIDLSAKYLDLALRTRLAQAALVDQEGG